MDKSIPVDMTVTMSTSKSSQLMMILSIILIITSVILFILGAIIGGVEIYLLIIIPVIKLNGIFGLLGLLALISGMVLLLLSKMKNGSSINRSDSGSKGIGKEMSSEWSGIIFIGPIPIVLGSNAGRKNLPKWRYLLLIGIGIAVITYLLAIAVLTFLISA